MNSRRLVQAAFIVALLVLIGSLAFMMRPLTPQVVQKDCGRNAVGADIGGPFQMQRHDGVLVTEADFAGTPAFYYFGFTFCPDICPTGLASVGHAVDLLEQQGIVVTPVFVTVDPERDTEELMADYVGNFHERMVGLTGDEAQIAAMAKAFRVYYAKHPDPDFPDGYSMDHSSFTYLMNGQNQLLTYFAHNDAPEKIAQRTACLLGR